MLNLDNTTDNRSDPIRKFSFNEILHLDFIPEILLLPFSSGRQLRENFNKGVLFKGIIARMLQSASKIIFMREIKELLGKEIIKHFNICLVIF